MGIFNAFAQEAAWSQGCIKLGWERRQDASAPSRSSVAFNNGLPSTPSSRRNNGTISRPLKSECSQTSSPDHSQPAINSITS